MQALAPVLLALLAAEPASPSNEAPTPPKAYASAVSALATQRARLAAEYQRAKPAQRQAILARARATILEAFDRDLIPAWFGTGWEFYGTSETPGQGTIACGYLVSTVLRDAGLKVERVRLAQQASENIVRSLTPAAGVLRFTHRSNAEVVAGVRPHGDGLYVVGLDYHVGFLRLAGDSARFCHSSFLGTRVVVCEDAATSEGMLSTLHVVGDALNDARILDWLFQRAIPTRGNQRS